MRRRKGKRIPVVLFHFLVPKNAAVVLILIRVRPARQALDVAALVVIRIIPQEPARRVELLLERAARRHAPRLEIAEIEIPAIQIARAIGRAAERAIRKQPPERRDIEPCPVVVPRAVRLGIQAALPLRRNAAQACRPSRL